MRKVGWILAFAGAAVLTLIGMLWLTGKLNPKDAGAPVSTSPDLVVPNAFKAGEALFESHCARCHGSSAVGTDQGPSLLWKIYAPNHHSDASFYLAVQQGVRAHHWRFGNMPAIPDVAQDEVTQVIAYLRWLQEQAGVR